MKLLILASHPVQYHAPVFRTLAQLLAARGDEVVVAYLSDFSIQGYRDREFGLSFAWDEPLLSGYRAVVLQDQQTQQPQGFWGLGSPGFGRLLDREKPDRLLLHTLNYWGAVKALLQARWRGIPCSLRVETNDQAVRRSGLKSVLRWLVYRLLYLGFDSAVAIGALNRKHLIAHGFDRNRVGLAYYCTSDRFAALAPEDKQAQRQAQRAALGLEDHRTALLFSGKLIPKKNPGLILEGIARLPENLRSRLAVLYVGAGQLEAALREQAAQIQGVAVHFLGFKNQQDLPPCYLAADVLVLPSQRAGETWGLVINEALQAGLPCIATEGVGCMADFAAVPGVTAIPIGDAAAMARAIELVLGWPRQFDRYATFTPSISTQAAAEAIATWLQTLPA